VAGACAVRVGQERARETGGELAGGAVEVDAPARAGRHFDGEARPEEVRVALQGGVPIVYKGQTIGAVGVSGAASAQQDDELATLGARAIDSEKTSQAPPTSPAPKPAAQTTGKQLVLRDADGVALEGYDPVAYFTDGKPVKGQASHSSSYSGAIYRFASADHKRLFDADPSKYAPQYGGYCGYAASIDRLSPINPEFWQIVDGRLILQHNQKAYDLFNADLAANVAKADGNWPGLVAKNGTGGPWLVNVDSDGVAIQGYDPVAYFTDGRPVKGDKRFESTFDGALYHFASAEHRVQFELEPTRYLPQYGGYCGYAASIDKVSPVNPEIWQIVDGRLILQHTPEAYRLFNENVAESVKRADANWPGLVASNGRREGESTWSRLLRRLGLG
jgi:YHS domain-containing protein